MDEELLRDWHPTREDPAALAVRVWRKCLRFMKLKGVYRQEENRFKTGKRVEKGGNTEG